MAALKQLGALLLSRPPSPSPSSTTEPPIASIFPRAESENLWAFTVRGPISSPSASTLTGLRRLRRIPRSFRSSGVTSVPASNTRRVAQVNGRILRAEQVGKATPPRQAS